MRGDNFGQGNFHGKISFLREVAKSPYAPPPIWAHGYTPFTIRQC